MKHLSLFTLVIISFLIPTISKAANIPRQKVVMSGELLPSSPKSVSVKDMESFKPQSSVKIYDPYNKNIETEFFGFYLSDFVKKYAKPDFKILRVVAIDGYKIDIPFNEIKASNLFVSYKDTAGYLTVDRMGPARIIAPVKGVINKDLLLKIGVYWVWQVKSYEFLK